MSVIGQAGQSRVTTEELRVSSQSAVDIIRTTVRSRIEDHQSDLAAGNKYALACPFRVCVYTTFNYTKLPKVIRDELKAEGFKLLSHAEKDSDKIDWYVDWEKPRKNSDSPSRFAPVPLVSTTNLPTPPPRAPRPAPSSDFEPRYVGRTHSDVQVDFESEPPRPHPRNTGTSATGFTGNPSAEDIARTMSR